MSKVNEDTGVITDFYIICYADIYDSINTIYREIKIPDEKFKPEGYVFDEDRSVKWNREQVELYNADIRAARDKAYAARNESLRNLDEAVIDYLAEYEAYADTPREVIASALKRAQADYDDEWWNYLGRYLDFAEDVIRVFKEVQNG